MTAQLHARVEAGGLLRVRMCGRTAQVSKYAIQMNHQCIAVEHGPTFCWHPAHKGFIPPQRAWRLERFHQARRCRAVVAAAFK